MTNLKHDCISPCQFDSTLSRSPVMEQSQFKTPNLSDTLFPFPPHRRRHLKSETFCTLVRILSHCYGGESYHSLSTEIVSAKPKQGSGESELEQGPDPEVHHGMVGPTCVDSETWLTRREAQSLKDVGIDQCFDDRMEIDESGHHVKGLINQYPGNGNKCGNTLQDNNPCGNFVSFVGNQEGEYNLLEICMEERGEERQEVDKEHPNSSDISDSLDLCLDIDIIDEFKKLDEINTEGSLFGQLHVLEHARREIPLTNMEKSVSSCGTMNSPLCSAADGQFEEGEISGSVGLQDQSTDLLVGHSTSLKKKANEEQTCEAISNEAQKEANQEDTKYSKNSVETIVNGVELTIGDSTMSAVDRNSEMVVCGQIGDAKMAHRYSCDSQLESRTNNKEDTRTNEKFNHPSESGDGVLLCYDDLYPAVPEKISGKNATENKGNLSAKKQDAVREKRKRGPMTDEKKAKKKKKKRIKRAETNKRLGVKRLKIQPVLKPKKVTYCRHYLKGRCQEGEKCKFSHDTIPLTKSTPCCHFARNSCMKGDDCPFDHQLSKYPCNNFLSKGSCSRGTECMFSHKIQSTECSPSTITQFKSPSLLRSTNLEKQSNSHASSPQKVDSKYGSTVIVPPRKKTEQNATESVLKPAVQTPKGISKLMFSVSNQAGSFAGAKFGLPFSPNTLGISKNSDENRRMREGLESKGVNFLSFGKAHLHDSSSKKSSSFSLSKDFGVQTSTFGNISKEKQAALSSHKDDLKVGNQNQSATPPVNEPRGINFFSFGKSPLDESSNKKLVITVPSNENSDGSSIQEGESASNGKNNIVLSSVQARPSASKLHIPNAEPWTMLSSSSSLQIPSAKPWKMLSSSLHSGKSMDRTTGEDGKDAPISSLKALFSNIPNSAQKGSAPSMPDASQKSLQSMLAFAAKYESRIKMDTPTGSTDSNQANSSSQSTRGSTILDFLYSGGRKTKQ